jgi:Fe-S-cluster containining protein
MGSLDFRRQVLELYRDVDRAVAAAGPVCVASGRCCRFKEWGHVLYLSNLEADVLLADAPAYERPVSPDFCPFQKEKLCTARESRPLGCRVYFCDPNYQEASHEITERFLHRLKVLAQENGVEWRYAPLHEFLNNGEAASSISANRETEKQVAADTQARSSLGGFADVESFC